MRRLAPLALLVLLVPVALATGIGGPEAPTRIPIPARDVTATVEDKGGMKVLLTRFSFNGEVFLYGTVGDGQVTVPFEKITGAVVKPSKTPKKMDVVATLKDGSSVTLVADDDLLVYGQTPYGYYQIKTEDLRGIAF
jgi:hypothetical protein